MKIKFWIPLCFIFLGVLSLKAGAASTPQGYLANRQGVDNLKKNIPSEAQNKFLAALAKDPYDARLHLNLGLTYEALGQLDKARASYETALQLAQDETTRFAANYNLGETYQKEKKTDEALHFYQEALQFAPDSQETKVNIELLTKDEQGKGKGKDKDDKDKNKDNKDGDQGDQKKDDPGKDDDKKDDKSGDKDKKEDQKPKQYKKNKPQPQKFKSEQLSPGDVNKILGEIKQQEQKIRGEFNKKEVKERPRDKDW